jgi:hypothetical protein
MYARRARGKARKCDYLLQLRIEFDVIGRLTAAALQVLPGRQYTTVWDLSRLFFIAMPYLEANCNGATQNDRFIPFVLFSFLLANTLFNMGYGETRSTRFPQNRSR